MGYADLEKLVHDASGEHSDSAINATSDLLPTSPSTSNHSSKIPYHPSHAIITSPSLSQPQRGYPAVTSLFSSPLLPADDPRPVADNRPYPRHTPPLSDSDRQYEEDEEEEEEDQPQDIVAQLEEEEEEEEEDQPQDIVAQLEEHEEEQLSAEERRLEELQLLERQMLDFQQTFEHLQHYQREEAFRQRCLHELLLLEEMGRNRLLEQQVLEMRTSQQDEVMDHRIRERQTDEQRDLEQRDREQNQNRVDPKRRRRSDERRRLEPERRNQAQEDEEQRLGLKRRRQEDEQQTDHKRRHQEDELIRPGEQHCTKNGLSGAYERLSFDDHLLQLLDQILRTPHRSKAMRRLESNRAQLVIDFLYSVLSQTTSTSLRLRKHTLIALYRLCKSSKLYPQLYVLKDISVEEMEDGGGFCDIHKGNHCGQELCLKVVRLFHKEEQNTALKLFAKEAILWGQLVHPNILPFYGVYYLDEACKRICLVSPWMKKGNLVRYLRNNPLIPRLPLVYDVIKGLGYLHSENVVHGDLKGANILITDSGRACIADFGLSSVLTDQTLPNAAATSTLVGVTYRWTAPELLDDSNSFPSRASDIWALGGVCYQTLTRLLPFHECSSDAMVIRKIFQGVLPSRTVADSNLDWIDDGVWIMMKRCWEFDPQSRPTCEQLIEEFELKSFADASTSEDDKQRFVLENAEFRDAMRKRSDVQIDSAGIERIFSEL